MQNELYSIDPSRDYHVLYQAAMFQKLMAYLSGHTSI